MKIRKLLCLLIAAALLLAGCGSDSTPEVTETQAPTQPSLSTPEAQISLILSQADNWKETLEGYGEVTFYYAITDLDQNGRLEIIAAATHGTGMFTYGIVREVTESYDDIVKCCEYNEDWPEVTVSSVPAAYDADSGCYDYLFTNTTRDGNTDSYESIVALRLQGGSATCTVLANSYTHYIDVEQEEHEYAVPSGDSYVSVTALEYNAVISDYQDNYQGFTANLEWFTLESELTEAVLTSSYQVFQASLDSLKASA